MADGLGLAETTPGPLILVTQFVGYLAAFRAPAPFTPFVAGVLGAGLTIWVTFAPCFLWIFALAPWIDRARNATRLKGGLAAITAAVVGVIANLTLWFAIHVLFRRTAPLVAGPIKLTMPDWASLNLAALALAVLAALLLFRTRLGMLGTLAICAAAGLGISAVAS
jgi:chromate transporter